MARRVSYENQINTPCRNRCRSSLAVNVLPKTPLPNLTTKVTVYNPNTTKPFTCLLQGKSIAKCFSALKQRKSKQRSRNEGKVDFSNTDWQAYFCNPISPKHNDLQSRYEKELISTYTSMIGEVKKVERESSLAKKVPRSKVVTNNKSNIILLKYKKVISIKPQEKVYAYESPFPFRVTKIKLRSKGNAN